jgi:ankyrin repeat protein
LLSLLRAGPASKSQISEALSGLSAAYVPQALRVALVHNQPLEVVAVLVDELADGGLEEPKDPDQTDDEKEDEEVQALEAEYEPLLSLALGNYANLEYLLQNKFPVDVSNDFGKTTLFYAIGSNNHAAVELLLRYKANVNHAYKSAKELRPDDDECRYPGLRHTRRSALMHAAQNSDVRMLQILLKEGARLDASDDIGFNAHDYALMGNNQDNARYLASLGLAPAALAAIHLR